MRAKISNYNFTLVLKVVIEDKKDTINKRYILNDDEVYLSFHLSP